MHPIPNLSIPREIWTISGRLDPEFCDHAIELGEAEGAVEASTVGDVGGRQGNVAWINDTALNARLAAEVARCNAVHFRYDLTAFYEAFQYADYGKGDFFDWHIDRAGSPQAGPRKLSFTVNLNEPSEYSGGDFEVLYGPKPEIIPLARGDIIIFDALMVHRITPIKHGSRKSLVGWACGPDLR
jgi:PKHD-type hydroxylase